MLTVALGNWSGACERMADLGPEQVEDPRQRLPQGADAEAAEDERRQLAAALAGDEDLGARGAFRIGQHAVLLHDQCPAQRHHHQHAEDAAGKRQQQDLRVVEVGRPVRQQEDQRGNREDDAARNRFAGRADRLHDVVLEDGRSA